MPQIAHAHAPFPGIRGFYVGFLHPLTQPAHVLLLLALCLWLGVRVGVRPLHSLIALGCATALGLLMAFAMASALPSQILILTLTAAVGLLIVSDWQAPAWLLPTLTAAGGWALALESIPDPGAFGDVAITTLGALAGIYYLVMYGTRLAGQALLRWPSRWMLLGFRVAGSWITAVCALMLAFALAGMPQAA